MRYAAESDRRADRARASSSGSWLPFESYYRWEMKRSSKYTHRCCAGARIFPSRHVRGTGCSLCCCADHAGPDFGQDCEFGLRPTCGRRVHHIQQRHASARRYAYRAMPTGYYFLPLLSPGRTRCGQRRRLSVAGIAATGTAVAGRIQIDFRLRPLSDVWEAGQYRSVFLPGSKTIVTFYGPDVDTSRSGTFEGQQGSAARSIPRCPM